MCVPRNPEATFDYQPGAAGRTGTAATHGRHPCCLAARWAPRTAWVVRRRWPPSHPTGFIAESAVVHHGEPTSRTRAVTRWSWHCRDTACCNVVAMSAQSGTTTVTAIAVSRRPTISRHRTRTSALSHTDRQGLRQSRASDVGTAGQPGALLELAAAPNDQTTTCSAPAAAVGTGRRRRTTAEPTMPPTAKTTAAATAATNPALPGFMADAPRLAYTTVPGAAPAAVPTDNCAAGYQWYRIHS